MKTEFERREAEIKAALKEKDAPDWRLMDTVELCPFPRQMTAKEQSQALDERAARLRMQGKSYGQIAQRLDIPKSSAYKRVKRCMQVLRQDFDEHEADLRDQCILALQQGIGQIITASSKGDKSAFKLVLQYVNTRLRLSKILDPAELIDNHALDAQIEQEEAKWKQQQEEARQTREREFELSRQKMDEEIAKAASVDAAPVVAESPDLVTGGRADAERGRREDAESPGRSVAEPESCEPGRCVSESPCPRVSQSPGDLDTAGRQDGCTTTEQSLHPAALSLQPDARGRNRGRTCGRSEQPIAAEGVAASDVFHGNGVDAVSVRTAVSVGKEEKQVLCMPAPAQR